MTTYVNRGAGDAGIAIIVGLLVGLIAAQLFGTGPKPADAVQSFDHSTCQYPDRWSNPSNGCDNSDPAVPECIKAASTQESEKACIDAFVAHHHQPTQSEAVSTTPPNEQKTYSTCGGK